MAADERREAREARVTTGHNVLVAVRPVDDPDVASGFCGAIVGGDDLDAVRARSAGKTVYLWGADPGARVDPVDDALADAVCAAARVFVVVLGEDPAPERAIDEDRRGVPWRSVGPGHVPIHLPCVGVLYRRLFADDGDVFAGILADHAFQALTESTKPGRAHRTGIYLTPVERDGDALRFRLLRCSTNLDGPTDNFRATDARVVGRVNQEADSVLLGHAPLNHVLAQIYHNTPATDDERQTKARIKAHADKTKDMPDGAVMAFCTFYDRLDGLVPLAHDRYDLGRNGVSALTRLVFRLKPEVAARPGNASPEQVAVTLYPGSVLLVPMSTNRAYTHEIRPASADAAGLPTRLGYVVRCSGTEAVHRDGQTWFGPAGRERRLAPPTPDGVSALRAAYAEENRTDAFVDYGDRFPFSMNAGDYQAPTWRPTDAFRTYPVSGWATGRDPFEALSDRVRFEDVGVGRRGAVLCAVDDPCGVPLVRTTTRSAAPARAFGRAHARLAAAIRTAASLPIGFNNALIERYTPAYATMGPHSDQAQDLAPGSFIALYTCYRRPDRAGAPRVLVVSEKAPAGGAPVESVEIPIPLVHGSVVVFSLAANARFRHRIVLAPGGPGGAPDDEWLGVTFRTSRTFVRYGDGGPRFADGSALTLADDVRIAELVALRRRENHELDFAYPVLAFTLSPGDLLPPAVAD